MLRPCIPSRVSVCDSAPDTNSKDSQEFARTIEEDSRSFRHHLSQPSWPSMFEIELTLRDRLGFDNLPGNVPLNGVRGSNFQLMRG